MLPSGLRPMQSARMPNDGPVRCSHLSHSGKYTRTVQFGCQAIGIDRPSRRLNIINRSSCCCELLSLPGMPEFFVANISAPVLPSMPPGGVSMRFTTSGVPRLPPSCHSPLLDMAAGATLVLVLFVAALRVVVAIAPTRVFEVVAAVLQELAGAGHDRRGGVSMRQKRGGHCRRNQ